ncbi:MAG TPA: ROK family protein [Chitinophagaceae bacterium]|nr:ROK family protein [Chitinophagaceae bacterium]
MDNDLLNNSFIGIDIGGSHITAAPISLSSGKLQIGKKVRQLVDAKGSKASIIKRWTEVITTFTETTDKSSVKIGIAMPGPFNYNEGISLIKGLNKYDALYGLNIRKELSASTGLPPSNILFRNDAESFLHGEIIYNKIPRETKALGVTLGTGLGAAISINRETKDVFRAIEPMYDGISEDYISTRWFQKRFKELTGDSLSDVKTLLKQDQLIQKKIFSEFGKNLGLFLDSFISDENATLVIIGGNIARCLDQFKEEALAQIQTSNIQIRQSTLWENAALIGAICSYKEAEKMILETTSKDLQDTNDIVESK